MLSIISNIKSIFLPKNIRRVALISLGLLSYIPSASAICPICTIAIGTGIGFSHWLGVDDTISGLWIGAFIMSLVIWTVVWCNKKNIRFKGRKISILILYYTLMLIPLYMNHFIGRPLNKLWNIDKLLLGIIVGSILFLLGYLSYVTIKTIKGQAQFPFQKVVMPIAPILIFTFIFYWITK
jgi:hypothetical protein